MDMAKFNINYIGLPPSLSKFISETNAISGGHLLEGKGINGGNGSF
jgi:hypothetical protein